VLRASVVSIVLLMAVGPDTALVCGLWCHHAGASMAECEHAHSGVTPSLTSADSCWRPAVSGTMFVREDVRGTSDRNVRHAAVVVPGTRVPAAPGDVLHKVDLVRTSPRESRPPVLALRI
jgi:hypothetical protein